MTDRPTRLAAVPPPPARTHAAKQPTYPWADLESVQRAVALKSVVLLHHGRGDVQALLDDAEDVLDWILNGEVEA